MYESRDVILYFQDLPSHDKFYHLILRQGNPPSLGWEVYFEFGKRGYPPQGKGFKAQGASYTAAVIVFNKVYDEKYGKGYRDSLPQAQVAQNNKKALTPSARDRDYQRSAQAARETIAKAVTLPEQKPTSKPAPRKPATPRLDDDAPVRVFDFDED